jgi:plasmid stabilization system protein ParE
VSRPRIELSPDALTQIRAIRNWWEENRPAAPDLFREELLATVEALQSAPKGAAPYPFSQIPGLRRTLMQRMRYHVYFTYNEDRSLIFIHAVWHASRGRGPRL